MEKYGNTILSFAKEFSQLRVKGYKLARINALEVIDSKTAISRCPLIEQQMKICECIFEHPLTHDTLVGFPLRNTLEALDDTHITDFNIFHDRFIKKEMKEMLKLGEKNQRKLDNGELTFVDRLPKNQMRPFLDYLIELQKMLEKLQFIAQPENTSIIYGTYSIPEIKGYICDKIEEINPLLVECIQNFRNEIEN